MKKLPCKDCGALILPATAESTGGICMACKQGIRRDIERSRAGYTALSGYDPVRELWKSLVARSSRDPELARFFPRERTYFTISLLEGEVYNGGFDQFFSNSSGMYYENAASGLAEMGASNSLTILRQACEAIFGESAPPADRWERWAVMEGKREGFPGREVILERLDKRFCEDPDNLVDLLLAYAEAHGLIEPFRR
jgi:hypothetical protein